MAPLSAWPQLLGRLPSAALLAALAAATMLAGWRRAHERHRRGAAILVGRAARAQVRRRRGGGGLALAGVPLALAEEVRHFKVLGTTGSGKSTAIARLLGAALARGDRAVVTDPDGAYTRQFRQERRGDVLLNPFDARARRWDPFGEIERAWDIEQLASSLISASADPAGQEWRGYARTLLSALLRRCWELQRREPRELWRLLTMATAAELRPLVAGTAAQPFLEPENARMLGSIRGVAASAAASFEHVQQQRARGFAVRQWVREGRGALFLPYAAAQIPALRGVLAAWVRLAIFEALQESAQERRLWFIVDELDALGAIDGLKDALARLRKFGGRCVLGFQSSAQVSALYGADAQTLVENCNNTLILRCTGSEHGGTAAFASRLIGEREVIRRQSSRTREKGRGGWGRGAVNLSEQHVLETAVLAAEIEQLPDLEGYFKSAGWPMWLRVRLPSGH
ncbi:MAG: type IV secretion system DNA-binding domain-containing protein [Gammaproteobacteria bacterium]|nr:type IV secretion system DNA-binding domain-containing protein [Gammaproteobacteria bacterium]